MSHELLHSDSGQCIEDYKVLDFLGKGAFAEVYKAENINTGHEVAIKMIDKGKMEKAKMYKQVIMEINIHKKLKHPSILKLHTVFEDQNYVYLVLEFCDNGDLRQHLKLKGNVLTEDKARKFMKQIVEGLIYLQSNNIVHRDITLANLLLTKDWNIKISDFGLATHLSHSDERHFTFCGTPNFISPEIVTNSSHGFETDVWSLGCILYTFLVGIPPFNTDGVKNTLAKVAKAVYDMPEGISIEAKSLIQELLIKNPKKRIKLKDIFKHPFMKKGSPETNRLITQASLDSGMGTISTAPSSRYTSSSSTRPMAAFRLSSLPTLTSQGENGTQGLRDASQSSRGKSPISPLGCAQLQFKYGAYREVPSSPKLRTHYQESDAYQPNNYVDSVYVNEKGSASDRQIATHDQLIRVHSPIPSGCDHGVEYCNHAHALGPNDGYCSNNNQSSKLCHQGRLRNKNEENRESCAMLTNAHQCSSGLCSERICTSQEHYGGCNCALKPCALTRSATVECSHHGLCGSSSSCSHFDICGCRRSKGSRSRSCEHLLPGNIEQCKLQKSTSSEIIRQASRGSKASSREPSPCTAKRSFQETTSKNLPAHNTSKPANKLVSQTSPLNSSRLRPTRQITKKAIASILVNGEVCMEFFKMRGKEEKVVDVLRISQDGQRIAVFQPNKGKGQVLTSIPPDFPEERADGIFGYENLPEKYWNKYIYAARFVEVVRAKTPKITLYTPLAKCMLMENSPNADFEVVFSTGEKFTETVHEVKIIELQGNAYTLKKASGESLKPPRDPRTRELYECFEKYHQHCLEMESILTEVEAQTNHPCFPVILGRRPSVSDYSSTPPLQANKENIRNLLKDATNRRNINTYSIPLSGSVINSLNKTNSQSPSEENSKLSASRRSPFTMRQTTYAMQPTTSSTKSPIYEKQGFVPNIGWALYRSSGDTSRVCYVDVRYIDGTRLTLEAGTIYFSEANGPQTKYGALSEQLPVLIKTKVSELRPIIKYLGKSTVPNSTACSDQRK